MTLKTTITASVIVVTILLGTAYSLVKDHKEAQAQLSIVPFTGKIAKIELCCNGLKMSFIQPPLTTLATQGGEFIFQWQNMVPIPSIGWGLYSAWQLTPGTTVLGSGTPGGVCVTIASECSVTQPVSWSISQMGTNIGPSNN